jgi:hypothetical protein
MTLFFYEYTYMSIMTKHVFNDKNALIMPNKITLQIYVYLYLNYKSPSLPSSHTKQNKNN